jgi:hypothetical protein
VSATTAQTIMATVHRLRTMSEQLHGRCDHEALITREFRDELRELVLALEIEAAQMEEVGLAQIPMRPVRRLPWWRMWWRGMWA